MRFSIASSSFRKACSWVGSVISIFASISVFLTSRAASTRAILASFTSLGIPGCTRSLSTMMPSTSCVSAIEPPCFFTIWMLSSSTKYEPSARCSATVVTAFTAMSARSSLWPLADLDDIEVIPTFFRVSSSLMEIFVATFSRTSWALSEAWRYPAAITVGWMFWSIRSSAFLSSSPAKMTAVVVPSPASSSWVFATSTSIFAAGCSMSISLRIVTPSFVMTTSPRLSTSILYIPRGPKVERTASATAFAAAMLLNCAPLPRSRRVPSFRTNIGVPAAGTPILVLKEGTRRERGKGAQFNNIAAAKAVADAVRSTLGPRGMDKMLVDSLGDVVITNDGVTILKEIDIEHPAAKMLVEVAKTQDEEAGDGTTTAVILAGELLKKAEDMIEQNIHPTVIASGYRLASEKAREVLEKIASKVSLKDEDILRKVAITAMASKSSSGHRDHLSDLVVRAVTRVAEERANGSYFVDDDDIQITKKQGGSIADTALVDGIIVDKERVHPGMPSEVKDAKIALVDAALEVKKTEIDAKIEITDPTQLQAFLNEEEAMLKRMVEIVRKSGATVIFCQKGIDDLAQHYLAKQEIYAVRRVKKSDMEKLAKATGGKVVTKLDELSKDDLGFAKLAYEKKIGDDQMTFVTGCKNPKAVSILLRGGTEHVVDELERSLEDATSVVAVAIEDGKVISGGGSSAMEIALALRDFASTVGGREQIAIEAFADAVEVIPRTLAENAGLDPIDILIELRKEHKKGNKYAGVNVFTGKVSDMRKENVVEPIRVGAQAISSATDAAVMILRIDDVIAARTGEGGKGAGGPKGGEDGGGDSEEF